MTPYPYPQMETSFSPELSTYFRYFIYPTIFMISWTLFLLFGTFAASTLTSILIHWELSIPGNFLGTPSLISDWREEIRDYWIGNLYGSGVVMLPLTLTRTHPPFFPDLVVRRYRSSRALRPSTDPNHPEKPQDPDGILNVAYFNAVSRNPDMPATLAEPFRNAIRNIPPQKSRDDLLKKMWDISGDFSRYARMPGYAYYTQTPFWFNDVVARYIRRTAPTIQYPPLHQN